MIEDLLVRSSWGVLLAPELVVLALAGLALLVSVCAPRVRVRLAEERGQYDPVQLLVVVIVVIILVVLLLKVLDRV